jgi:hypothetical protein
MKYIVTLILIGIANFSYASSFTQEFTEVELQEKISAMMPIVQKNYFMTIVFDDPVIDLHETSNELSIRANIRAVAPGGIEGSGTTQISGSISYNPGLGTFHLKNPTIIDLQIDNIQKQYLPDIKKIAQIVLSNALANYPLYTLEDDNLKHHLAKSMLESVIVKDEKLQITLNLL